MATVYCSIVPPTITAPDRAEPGTLITVQASRATDFLVTGTDNFVIVGNTLVLLTGKDDIRIITSGPTETVILVASPSPLSSLIHSAPTTNREAVAKSLRDLGQSTDIKTVDELVKLTRINNRALIEDNWKPWFNDLSSYLEANHQTADLLELQQLWITIANQLDGVF